MVWLRWMWLEGEYVDALGSVVEMVEVGVVEEVGNCIGEVSVVGE